jgi:adenylate cyclase
MAMSAQAKILVVDDTPQNVKLLADLLAVKGYAVATASSGEEALAKVAAEKPDLILLDVMMPGMSGYDVCRRLRAEPATELLPIVLCTSLDPGAERINGIAAGADDFLGKPINQPELFARVASLLRISRLHEETRQQAAQLAEWGATLERRVAEQVAENERLSRLKRFLSPKLAELIVNGTGEDPLKSRRREIVVIYCDLRGFTAYAETSEPEELMRTLGSFHGAMGRIVIAHDATLERFTGDGMMVFLGDPVPVENAAERAVALALEMRSAALELSATWKKRGVDLGLGIGIAQGFATVGAIGFDERIEYTAIGTVTNLAARLCQHAKAGEIIVSQRVYAEVGERVEAEDLGELQLHGFARPTRAFRCTGAIGPGLQKG